MAAAGIGRGMRPTAGEVHRDVGAVSSSFGRELPWRHASDRNSVRPFGEMQQGRDTASCGREVSNHRLIIDRLRQPSLRRS